MDGKVETIEGRPALLFERRLAHPVERVWRAMSDSAELSRWFVGPVPWTPDSGEVFEVQGQSGEITELEPPHVLAWTWGGQEFRFEISEASGTCVLAFTHVFPDRELGAQHAAGWEACFARLDAHLAGRALSEKGAHEGVTELDATYAEAFAADPDHSR